MCVFARAVLILVFPPFCYLFRTNDYFIFNSILFYFQCFCFRLFSFFGFPFFPFFPSFPQISTLVKFALQKWRNQWEAFDVCLENGISTRQRRGLLIAAETATTNHNSKNLSLAIFYCSWTRRIIHTNYLSLEEVLWCKKFIVYASVVSDEWEKSGDVVHYKCHSYQYQCQWMNGSNKTPFVKSKTTKRRRTYAWHEPTAWFRKKGIVKI